MEYFNDSINRMIDEFEEKLGKAATFVQQEFASIRAGRVSPVIVERITVNYFDQTTPIKNLGNITSVDSRTIVINLWDVSILRDVCKAIEAANIGANPIDDGRVIRLIFPILTEERRKELVRQVKKICEDGKIILRNERRSALDALRKIVKEEKVSEDDHASVEKDIQKITDSYVASLDKILQKKETEIMEI